MREEILVIENGSVGGEGNEIFHELYLQIYKSELFGIIFDNILERKCLLDFLKGNCTLDSGTIYVNNQKILPSECLKQFGPLVAVIEKNGKLMNSLSIPENVLLFAKAMRKYIIEKKKYESAMEKIKKELQITIRTDKPVSALTEKERVMIELIKAFAEGKKLIALADISGFLKSNELEEVFSLMVRLRRSGMTFIIIESLGDMILKWAERLAIIRNGKTLGIVRPQDVKRQQVYSALIGDQKNQPYNKIVSVNENEAEETHPVLKFVNINTEILKNLNFSINREKSSKSITWMTPAAIISRNC